MGGAGARGGKGVGNCEKDSTSSAIGPGGAVKNFQGSSVSGPWWPRNDI